MARWLMLLLVGLFSASTSYEIPRREILPPPPWNSADYKSHTSQNSLPSFQRGSVESPPKPIGPPTRGAEVNLEFGSQRFPLRDAVEALPETVLVIASHKQPFQAIEEADHRVPLRDAVEHREAPFIGGIDQESIWIEPLIPPTLQRLQRLADPKVVCHFDSRSAHRVEPFSLPPQAIPDFKCTHLVYSRATIDPIDLTIVPRDHDYDVVKGGYKSATILRHKNPALRVLISLSCPNKGQLFAAIRNEKCSAYCEKFTDSIVQFLKRYGFDGIEIDWENLGENLKDSKVLLKAIGESLKDKGFTLVVALRSEDPVDPEILSLVDFVNLRAWRASPDERREKLALHSAPLNYVARMTNKWVERVSTRDLSKIVLGVPLFGQGHTLKFNNYTDAGAPVIGSGIGGTYTKLHNGRQAYFEVCEKLEEELWISGRDTDGPYVKRGDQWISYEDVVSVKIKMAYIRSVGLGGVSLWSLDLDDFQGICGNPWPVLNAATNALGIYNNIEHEKCSEEGLRNDRDNCAGFFSCIKGMEHRGNCGTGRFFDSSKGQCVSADTNICKPGYLDRITVQQHYTSTAMHRQESGEQLEEDGPKVVCYITSWALYRKDDGKFVPEQLDTNLCTHVIYAFAGLNPDTLLIQLFDPWADVENSLYERVTSIDGPRVLLALGGWTDSSEDKYSRLVSSGSSRRKFVTSTISFLKKHNFDGLSLEWNYPTCWQSDCRKGPPTDKPNFTKLIRELKEEFKSQDPPLTLSVALSGYREVIDRAYEVTEISRIVDFMSVMTYDYHGAWETKTGHLAPLYGSSIDNNVYYNVNYTMQYLTHLGAERSKLLVGIPLYGQAYRLSDPKHSNLGDSATGPGMPGEFTRQPGMLAYYEICERIRKQGWKTGKGPSAYHADQWVGYEDRNSVAEKGKYILQNGYGGAVMWTVDLDDFQNRCCKESFPLLKSINRALGRLQTEAIFGEDCRRPVESVTPIAPTLTTHSDAAEGGHRPTKPMSPTTTTRGTTWPTWTEKPSTTSSTVHTTKTTWPTWSWTTHSTMQTSLAPITTTTTKRPEETTLTTSTTGATCSLGQYISDPLNCDSYYRCVLGELKREQCAPGLHWDVKRSICDWPSVAKCQSKTDSAESTSRPSWTSATKTTTTITTTTTQRPTTTTSRITTHHPTFTPIKPIIVVKPTEKPDKACEHGQYYPFPDSCTSFMVCVNGHLIAQQCGPGLNWNQEKNMCDWAFKNPCSEKSQENSLLVMKETPCVSGSYTGVPGDCSSYHACLWGRRHTFQCPPELHFNKMTKICDWPSHAKCEDTSDPDSGIEVESVTTTSKPQSTRPPYAPTTLATTERPTWKPTTTQVTPTLPSAEVDPEKVSPLSGHFKVVCYFTNWAWYRRGVGRYLPEHIDHTLCTHIVYGFAVLDYSELTIKAHDSWADFDNRFYERVVAYKKRGLKVLLALGGWNDSAGDKYSRLVNNPAARKKFVDHVVKFIEKHGFDGLDLDWEYPVCWQVNCKKGPASDKESFAMLLKELSAVLKPKGLLLTSAVSPSKTVIDKGYDVPALAKYLDWIAVMTYDFHGQWDKRTGHVAPLYYHPDDEYDYFNANYSINYWISKGAPPRSIVMGVPLYGQSFSINDPSAGVDLNVPASAGNAGEFTRAAGFLAYYEICDRILRRGWKVVQDPERRMGPYAYKGNQWVSFDNAEMVSQKAQYIRDMGLGGGMVWALDLDDFRGRCDDGPHPLMHTLQRVLANGPSELDKPPRPHIMKVPATVPEIVTTPIVPTTSGTNQVEQDKKGEFKMVCYFTNWAWYRQEGGKYVPEDIDTDLCTHIIYGFAVLDTSSLTIKSHDPWADIDNKFYERVVQLKSKGVKVLMAIGGWNDSAGNKYSRLVNSPAARRKFVSQVVQFIEKYGFEGLDLDWEYPVCWQVDCKKGPASDKAGFSELVKELSEEFKPKGLLLSAAVSPSKRVIDAGYDVPVLAKYLDWISVMTYDYHGQWDKKTGHVAPLYPLPSDWEPTFNANFSMHYWMEQGAPAKKLVMGAPLYGQSFSLAERSQIGLNAPTYGGGEAGEATRARGFLSYYEICERTLKKGWTVVQDKERRIGPYAYHGDQWVSFDDTTQIKLKAEFIKNLGLGGGMVWALDLDDFKNRCGCEPSPLLRTMNRVLRNYPKGPLCPIATNIVTIDINESAEEQATTTSTTTKWPTYESTTAATSGPTYLPPKPTSPAVVMPDIDDTVEIEAGTPPPLIPPIGDCGGRLFIPHKDDCSKYYLCNFGKLSIHSCPPGLHWNENRCDWPENSKCKNEVRRKRNSLSLPFKKHVDTKKKIVCYFTSWSSSRLDSGKFLPEDIIPGRCTHVIYGFAELDLERLTMHVDYESLNSFLQRMRILKTTDDVKVLIALGGWNESKDDKYSVLSANPISRKVFAQNVVEFLEKHELDGLDLDWEYPVCWQVDCNRGPPTDKESFTLLLHDLNAALKSKGFLLSVAASPSKQVIDVAYDVPSVAKHVDWINVLSYDYHGPWEQWTAHVAPLYNQPGDDFGYLTVNFSINYWLSKGAPAEKLVLGIPAYGQSYTLREIPKEHKNSGFGLEVSGPGQAGEFTRVPGCLSYYEICMNVRNKQWIATKDSNGGTGPYATKDDQWVSYDDVSNVIQKAELIRHLNLGGGMIWALDMDDFKGQCHCGKYPLLTALTRTLSGTLPLISDCT